jgi:hypothetical protein
MDHDMSKYLFILLLLFAIGCRVPADTRKKPDLVQNNSSYSDGLIISGANIFIDAVRNDGISHQISLIADTSIVAYHILKSAGALSNTSKSGLYSLETDYVKKSKQKERLMNREHHSAMITRGEVFPDYDRELKALNFVNNPLNYFQPLKQHAPAIYMSFPYWEWAEFEYLNDSVIYIKHGSEIVQDYDAIMPFNNRYEKLKFSTLLCPSFDHNLSMSLSSKSNLGRFLRENYNISDKKNSYRSEKSENWMHLLLSYPKKTKDFYLDSMRYSFERINPLFLKGNAVIEKIELEYGYPSPPRWYKTKGDTKYGMEYCGVKNRMLMNGFLFFNYVNDTQYDSLSLVELPPGFSPYKWEHSSEYNMIPTIEILHQVIFDKKDVAHLLGHSAVLHINEYPRRIFLQEPMRVAFNKYGVLNYTPLELGDDQETISRIMCENMFLMDGSGNYYQAGVINVLKDSTFQTDYNNDLFQSWARIGREFYSKAYPKLYREGNRNRHPKLEIGEYGDTTFSSIEVFRWDSSCKNLEAISLVSPNLWTLNSTSITSDDRLFIHATLRLDFKCFMDSSVTEDKCTDQKPYEMKKVNYKTRRINKRLPFAFTDEVFFKHGGYSTLIVIDSGFFKAQELLTKTKKVELKYLAHDPEDNLYTYTISKNGSTVRNIVVTLSELTDDYTGGHASWFPLQPMSVIIVEGFVALYNRETGEYDFNGLQRRTLPINDSKLAVQWALKDYFSMRYNIKSEIIK